jgi:hypothetical protein
LGKSPSDCFVEEAPMSSSQPRRDFLQALMALPMLSVPPITHAAIEYELNEFAVAGLPYYDGPALLDELQPGDSLTLVAEPDNPFDERAIRIEAQGRKIGYVPRGENGPLVRLMGQGVSLRARVARIAPEAGPWSALTVLVSMRQ